MKKIWFVKILAIVALLATPVASLRSVEAEPNSFNDPNMQVVWERTDKPVEMFVTQRSYTWGPNTLAGSPSTEPYATSPGGNRTVQYFDKSRMEVNNPNGDRSQLFFITNGLLVREMVSGQLQLGDNTFELRAPSFEAVAGDPAPVNPDAPTYATFHGIATTNNNNPSPDRTGQPVVEAISKVAVTSTIASPDPSVSYVTFEPNIKHNIPNKFADFLNQTGPVFVNGQIAQDTVINGAFLAGFPITEAYWVQAKVAGQEKDVLVQLYERRALTYTPSNPAGFQVEMGNAGQHYLRWRYGGPPKGEERIAFASNRSGELQIYSMKSDGSDVKQLTTTTGGNFTPRWSPDNQKIAFISKRNGPQELWAMNADGGNQTGIASGAEVLTMDWSPDGSRIYFERETMGGDSEIFSARAGGGAEKQLTTSGLAGNPIASPDGTKLAFAQKDPTLSPFFQVYVMNADGSNPHRLFFGGSANHNRPTDWKDDTILYRTEFAQFDLWSTDDAGNVQTPLLHKAFSGAFSPDASKIVVAQIQPSGFVDISTMNADGTGLQQLTNTPGKLNLFPDWGN